MISPVLMVTFYMYTVLTLLGENVKGATDILITKERYQTFEGKKRELNAVIPPFFP